MRRLTADQFVEKIKTAPGWQVVAYPEQEIRLFIKHKVTGPVQEFLGPDPLETDADMYQAFLYRVEAEAQPTHSQINVNVPRISAEEFFAKIDESVLWSVSVLEDDESMQLLVMPPGGKFEHYLSTNIREMNETEFTDFIARIKMYNSKDH